MGRVDRMDRGIDLMKDGWLCGRNEKDGFKGEGGTEKGRRGEREGEDKERDRGSLIGRIGYKISG